MLDKFFEITGIDLKQFITDCSNFLLSDSITIKDYYIGSIDYVPLEVVGRFTELQLRYLEIENTIQTFNGRFITSDFWELVEIIDDLGVKLEIISQYRKWLRSNRNSFLNSNMISEPSILSQNQSLENVSENTNIPWDRIAIDNDLNEENYTKEGGNKINLTYSETGSSFVIESIVDSPVGENVYGKDILKDTSIIDNDLLCLDCKDTLYQSFGILLGLIRGSLPEDKNIGIDKSILSENGTRGTMYPIMIRQLFSNFKMDDSFKSLSIDSITQNSDIIEITVSASPRIGESVSDKILI